MVMNVLNVAGFMLLSLVAFATRSVSTAFTPVTQTALLQPRRLCASTNDELSLSEDDDINLEAFQARKRQQEEAAEQQDVDEEFDGYAMRDIIYEKWGLCYDVDFNRVDSFGFRQLYLNILPFYLGGRRFRHKSELDYLCHLQAVVEILQKYKQLDYVIAQINETDKKPRAGTSPLVAVPIRLDLTREQVQDIIGY